MNYYYKFSSHIGNTLHGTHVGEKPYKCEVCDTVHWHTKNILNVTIVNQIAKYVLKGNSKWYIRIHTGEKLTNVICVLTVIMKIIHIGTQEKIQV